MITFRAQYICLLEANIILFPLCKPKRLYSWLALAEIRGTLRSSTPSPFILMSKQDLIAAIADAAGITKRAASDALQAVINIVVKNLKKGTPVTITGFGTFKLSHRAARMGVNPRNPTQRISIPAMKVPSFKAGKTLKDAVR